MKPPIPDPHEKGHWRLPSNEETWVWARVHPLGVLRIAVIAFTLGSIKGILERGGLVP